MSVWAYLAMIVKLGGQVQTLVVKLTSYVTVGCS
jgi:hypothetical protein